MRLSLIKVQCKLILSNIQPVSSQKVPFPQFRFTCLVLAYILWVLWQTLIYFRIYRKFCICNIIGDFPAFFGWIIPWNRVVLRDFRPKFCKKIRGIVFCQPLHSVFLSFLQGDCSSFRPFLHLNIFLSEFKIFLVSIEIFTFSYLDLIAGASLDCLIVFSQFVHSVKIKFWVL